MSKNAKTFGELIKQVREEKNLTQLELALAAQVSAATISLVERGINSIDPVTATQVMAALKIPKDKRRQFLDALARQESKGSPAADYPLTAAAMARIRERYGLKGAEIRRDIIEETGKDFHKFYLYSMISGKAVIPPRIFTLLVKIILPKRKVSKEDINNLIYSYMKEVMREAVDKFEFLSKSQRAAIAETIATLASGG